MVISTFPPIAIIGGGPCGLMLARLLQTASIDYVVFERDDSPTSTLRSQGGKFRASFGDDDGGDRPEIDRQQLRQLLLNSLSTDRIRWGKILDAVHQSRNGEARDLTLKFRDGSSESGFRLIVGADGAWSKVRSLVTDAKPIYSGKSFIEGRISPDNSQYKLAEQITGKGTAMAMSAKSTLAIQQLSDASYRIYMGVVAPESLTRPGGDADPNDMDKARRTMLGPGGFYETWTNDLRHLIEASEGPWRPWPLYRLDKALFSSNDEDVRPRWKRVPGVVLLGDAAHLATPNGEGVNQAMHA
ncbi:tetracycline resistance protein [Fusarium denticulatum]|uniref:Tetracycline resistance protein n=1 Tax=Fusarium denticulatum TaxID=48507 RepID=A0A8H5WUX3_9HYPO|nr:tetracycline resistance protein [Fusarium denticulatum]